MIKVCQAINSPSHCLLIQSDTDCVHNWLVRLESCLCYGRIFQDVKYPYDSILEKLRLQTLHIRRRYFDASLLINFFTITKYYPSVLEKVVIRVPTQNELR
jgi:hypothetical protein